MFEGFKRKVNAKVELDVPEAKFRRTGKTGKIVNSFIPTRRKIRLFAVQKGTGGENYNAMEAILDCF